MPTNKVSCWVRGSCVGRCSNPVLSWGTQSLGLMLTPYVYAGALDRPLGALPCKSPGLSADMYIYRLSFVVGTLNS